MSNRRNIPRLANIADLLGVTLLVIGAGCYLRAYMGMSALRANGGSTGKARFAGIAEFDRYYQLSRFGLLLGAVAVLVLIAGAVVTWRARRGVSTTLPATAEVVAGS